MVVATNKVEQGMRGWWVSGTDGWLSLRSCTRLTPSWWVNLESLRRVVATRALYLHKTRYLEALAAVGMDVPSVRSIVTAACHAIAPFQGASLKVSRESALQSVPHLDLGLCFVSSYAVCGPALVCIWPSHKPSLNHTV